MKKLFLMMVFSLSVGLVACGGNTANTEQQVQESEQTQTEDTEQDVEQDADTKVEEEGENEAAGSENETTVTEGETTETETSGQENTEAEAPKEAKKASELDKADYEQLTSLMSTVETFADKYIADNKTMTEQIKNGKADAKECVKKYKEYVEEANAIMEQISAAEWETEDCDPYATLLAQGIGSLRAGGEICIQAMELENADLLTATETYFNAYAEYIVSLHKGLGI